MEENNKRELIIDSIIEFIDKKDNSKITILNKYLKFEMSKYTSIKKDIWQVYINNIRLNKKTEYLINYKCLTCDQQNIVSTTQFLRKIRECKSQCFQCHLLIFNKIKYDSKEHIIKKELSLEEYYEKSKEEFDNYPDIYKNSYLLSHLNDDDYIRIKKNIISYGNGKYKNIDDYDYWSIYKVNNQMKFSSVLYDKINNIIFKANQPIIKCDNCEKNWRCKSLELFKNCYKILCPDCKLCNRTFKLRPIKNINNEIIMYQSKLELKFVNWCEINNYILKNGPNIDYEFNDKKRKYRVNFQIKDILIEIKDFHIWHKNQVESGLWEVKMNAINQYIKKEKLKKYYFITPNNWNQMCKELKNLLEN